MAEQETERPQGGKGDPEAAFQKLLDKHNSDGVALARLLHGENFDLRQKNADLRARVPGEGARVLTPEEAAAFESYRALGKPEDLRKAVREREEFERVATAARFKEEVEKVAEVAGMKPRVLLPLAERDRLAFEVKDVVDERGKKTPTAFVKGEGDERVKLHEYAERHWGDFLPSLLPEGGVRPAGPRGTPHFDASRRRPEPERPRRDRPDEDPVAAQAARDVGAFF